MLLQEREARREWHQRPHHNQRDGNVRRFVSRIETRAKLTRDVDPRREKQPFLNASGQVFHHDDYPCDQKKGSGYDGPHGDRAGVAASFAMGYAVSDLRGCIDRSVQIPTPPSKRHANDGDDRLWCVAEFNTALSRRGFWRRIRKGPPVPADIGWDDLTKRMRGAGMDVRTPPDFDETAYLRANPDVAEAVERGVLATGFMHYVLHGRGEGRPRQTRSGQ